MSIGRYGVVNPKLKCHPIAQSRDDTDFEHRKVRMVFLHEPNSRWPLIGHPAFLTRFHLSLMLHSELAEIPLPLAARNSFSSSIQRMLLLAMSYVKP